MDMKYVFLTLFLRSSLIFIGKVVLSEDSGRRFMLLAFEYGIDFVEGIPDLGWSANNKTAFVRSLNFTGQGQITHLTGDYADEILVWFDPKQSGSILYVINHTVGSNVVTPVRHFHDRCSLQVNGISLDWINNNVYWIDAVYNWIMMASIAAPQQYVRVVVDAGISNPTAMTIFPQRSYIFWADTDFAEIKRSDLSGNQMTTVAYVSDQWIVVLVADIKAESLIWLNVFHSSSSIESMSLDGSRRSTILQSPVAQTFADLTVYNNLTFLLRKNRSEISILGRNNISSIPLSSSTIYNAMYVFAPEQQPFFTSPCWVARCQHLCVTVDNGSKAVCLCSDGYHLVTDGSTCQANTYLTSPKYLVFLGPAQGYLSYYEVWAPDWNEQTNKVILQGLNSLTAFAVSHNGHSIYVGRSEGTVELIPLLSTSASYVVRRFLGVGRVEGIAIDWISLNVYWTDSYYHRIMVARNDLSSAIVLHADLYGPSGIVVDALNRRIFWVDVGHQSFIMMSSTDGNNKTRCILSGLISPEKLVIDYVHQRLYWTDSGKGTIEFVSLNGPHNRQIFVQRLTSSFLYGIAVFQDYVAWTERGSSSKGIFWKLNSDVNTSIFKTFYRLTDSPGEIMLYGSAVQPERSGACSDRNGGCSFLCLPTMNSSSSHSCICPLGYDLNEDGTSCSPNVLDHPEDNFLLVVDSFHPAVYQVDIDSEIPRIFPLPFNQRPAVVSFDRLSRTLYWSDVANSMIWRGSLDGNDTEVFLNLTKGSCSYSIFFDENSCLLYFTLNTSGDIYASLANATNQTTVLVTGLNMPRDVAIHASDQTIYWTEAGKIGRAQLNNTANRTYLVNDKQLTSLQGLALHQQWNQMFWCNGSMVYVSDLNGNNISTIFLGPSVFCFGLVTYDDVLYATDSYNQDVICINWIHGTFYSLQQKPYQKLAGINVVPVLRYNYTSASYDSQSHSVSAKNGIIVGSVLGATVLILASLSFIIWKWRKNERPKSTRSKEPQKPRHSSDRSRHPSSISISDDMTHVSYYAKGVFRNSHLDPIHSDRDSAVYNTRVQGQQRRGMDVYKTRAVEKESPTDSDMYETASVISDAPSNSPFVRIDSGTSKQKHGRKKHKTGQKNNHSHSEDKYYTDDIGPFNSRTQISRRLSLSDPPTSNFQHLFGGRSWGDSLPKRF